MRRVHGPAGRPADDAREASRGLRLAESNVRFGHLDAIIGRRDIRPYVGRVLSPTLRTMARNDEVHLRDRLSRLKSLRLLRGASISGEMSRLERQLEKTSEPTDEEIWQHVELARHDERPYTLDYVERIFEDFIELHGDRSRAEDPAMVVGLGRLNGRTVALLGQQKGRDTKDRIRRNYGMAYPEGYRKAMRTMDPRSGTAFRSSRWSTHRAPSPASRRSSTGRAAPSHARSP